jgi:branched-chain amino acid transport system permease protein
MLSPLVVGTLIQTAIVIILCIGFTFTYMVEKFPNFAHTATATFGTVISFTLVRIYGLDPYVAVPFSAFFCGLLGVVLYIGVVRPIKATGAREITLTFVFLALSQMMFSIVNIYSYWYVLSQGSPTAGFVLYSFDFNLGGYPGVLLVTLPVCALLIAVLWYFLTRMKQGIALRAVAEDEALASGIGINVKLVHTVSWFVTGALAGLAGGLIPLWRYTSLGFNDQFLILVIAGSVMGGMNNIAGALIGGFLTSMSQKVLGFIAVLMFGYEAAAYEPLYPTLLIATILMLQPEGIMGYFEHAHKPLRYLRNSLDRIRRRLAEVIHAA